MFQESTESELLVAVAQRYERDPGQFVNLSPSRPRIPAADPRPLFGAVLGTPEHTDEPLWTTPDTSASHGHGDNLLPFGHIRSWLRRPPGKRRAWRYNIKGSGFIP